MKAAQEITQIKPAGIILPDFCHREPITPASTNEVPNCTHGFGGSCEFKWAPYPNHNKLSNWIFLSVMVLNLPKIAPNARPAANEGIEAKTVIII